MMLYFTILIVHYFVTVVICHIIESHPRQTTRFLVTGNAVIFRVTGNAVMRLFKIVDELAMLENFITVRAQWCNTLSH